MRYLHLIYFLIAKVLLETKVVFFPKTGRQHSRSRQFLPRQKVNRQKLRVRSLSLHPEPCGTNRMRTMRQLSIEVKIALKAMLFSRYTTAAVFAGKA
jgi:hypothetical protein